MRAPDPVDIHIGRRLRRRRLALKLDGAAVDRSLGESPGTVERFESGRKAVGASHLLLLSRALGVPVSYFFAGLPKTAATGSAAPPDTESEKELNRFLRAYSSLADDDVRKRLFNLVKSVADGTVKLD